MEARSAVQKHIEKMLTNNNQPASTASANGLTTTNQNFLESSRKIEVKHTMHGVSHSIPGEMDEIEKPLPVHYGVDQAIRSGSVALKSGRRQEYLSTESLTTIVKEPSLARGMSQDSVVQVRVTSPSLDHPSLSPGSGTKRIIPLRNGNEHQESSEGKNENFLDLWSKMRIFTVICPLLITN